jgi:hypothetical protein
LVQIGIFKPLAAACVTPYVPAVAVSVAANPAQPGKVKVVVSAQSLSAATATADKPTCSYDFGFW